MNRKGQGAIEYLLIIGAAILVVAVVIIALVSVTGTATEGTQGDEAQAAQQLQQCIVQCAIQGGDWNYTTTKCDSLTTPEGDYAETDSETGPCVKYIPTLE
jgi:type II secretory pathway pseudopilin PulG